MSMNNHVLEREDEMDSSSVIGLIVGVILAILTIILILWGNKKIAPAPVTLGKTQVPEPVKPAVPEQEQAEGERILRLRMTEAPVVSGTSASAPFLEGSAVEATPAAPVKPDDLTIVEGIGPKIAALLGKNGIQTFAQLASAELSQLEKILRENGLQFAKPASWPAQAKLAADGKLDELKAMQDKLVAGRY
jgi:predicted flap endonuclease-1-like 5' DNA nuclease